MNAEARRRVDSCVASGFIGVGHTTPGRRSTTCVGTTGRSLLRRARRRAVQVAGRSCLRPATAQTWRSAPASISIHDKADDATKTSGKPRRLRCLVAVEPLRPGCANHPGPRSIRSGSGMRWTRGDPRRQTSNTVATNCTVTIEHTTDARPTPEGANLGLCRASSERKNHSAAPANTGPASGNHSQRWRREIERAEARATSSMVSVGTHPTTRTRLSRAPEWTLPGMCGEGPCR